MKVMPLDGTYRISLEIAILGSALAGSLQGKLEGLMPLVGTHRISLEIAHYGPVFEGSLKVPEFANRAVLPDGLDALGQFLPHLVGDSILVQPLLAP